MCSGGCATVSSVTILLTPREAAERIDVTPKTIRNWAAAGRIDAIRRGGRILVSADDVRGMLRPVAQPGEAECDASTRMGGTVELTEGAAESSESADIPVPEAGIATPCSGQGLTPAGTSGTGNSRAERPAER
jgi:excisionase family DNA binding protein